MKSFETLRTWLIIGGLILFSAVASVIWLTVSGQGGLPGLDLGGISLPRFAIEMGEPITIQLDQYLLGEVLVDAPIIGNLQGQQVHPLILAAILAAVTVGGLLVVGVPLAFIYVMLDRQAEQVKDDPQFQEQQSALAKKETERLRAVNAEQPATAIPSHQMPRWATASTALVIVFFVILVSYALADTFFPGGELLFGSTIVDPALLMAVVLGLITVIALALTLGRRPMSDEAETEDGRVPWGAIWVAVTGFIFLGIGTGLMLAIRSAGG